MDVSNLTLNVTWPDDPSTTFPDYADWSGYSYPTDTYEPSYYTVYFPYNPYKSVNTAFAILFGIAALLFLVQGIASGKKWLGFTIAMVCGCIVEVIGYVGRIRAHNHLNDMVPFLTQIVCLTIAPAFLAAGIYFCLSHIVATFGAENSRIKPRSYPIIFVICDFLSLVLQSVGGGIASVRTQDGKDPKLGNNIMLAGLSVQVTTLFVFILLVLDFAVHTIRRIRQLGADGALDVRYVALRKSWAFKGFMVALSLSTLLIFTRCVYRVAELSKGWTGHLYALQGHFIGLEGVVIIAAVYLLNIFHPGFCFEDMKLPTAGAPGTTGKSWFGRRSKDVSEESSLQETKTGEDATAMAHNGHHMAAQV